MMNNLVKKKGITNKDLLSIIVCQLEAMMDEVQLEKYKKIRQGMKEIKDKEK